MADVDWPDFEVPAEALSEGAKPDAPAVAKPETPVVPPAAPAPPAAAAPAAAPAGTPGTTGNQPPAAVVDDGATVPRYRLDEIREQQRAAELRAQNAEAELARLRATPPPPAAAPPPAATPPAVDPANEAIRQRLLEVFPEFARLKEIAQLAERSGDIEGVVAAQKEYERATEQFYDRHTAGELSALHTMAAVHVLGAGKTAADLPEMAREAITERFAAWVQKDPARVARYNKLDSTLREEFWPVYRAAMYDPAKRADSVAALTAAGARPALPVGGATSAPVAPAPPKPATSDNEDDIHERAWASVQAAQRG